MKVRRGVVSTLDERGATVAPLEEKNYMTGLLKVPAWLRAELQYPGEFVCVGDTVLYAEFLDGTGRVLGKA